MVSFIIVDYKSYSKTIEYVNRIITSLKDVEFSFVIVDNSVDNKNFNDFLDYYSNKKKLIDLKNEIYSINHNFEKKNVNIILCKNSINGGYAQGNNLGFSLAKKIFNPQYVIFSNNDIEIDDSKFDLKKCLDIFDRDLNAAALGPAIKGLDGESQTPCKEMNIYERWIRFLWIYPLNKIIKKYSPNDLINIDSQQYVFRVMGSFIIFKSEKFEEIGQFDSNTFLFAEELIIAQKMKSKNLKTIYYPSIELVHAHGETINKSINKYKKLKLRFNSEMYYYKTYCNTNMIFILIAKLGLYCYFIKDWLYSKIKVVRSKNSGSKI